MLWRVVSAPAPEDSVPPRLVERSARYQQQRISTGHPFHGVVTAGRFEANVAGRATVGVFPAAAVPPEADPHDLGDELLSELARVDGIRDEPGALRAQPALVPEGFALCSTEITDTSGAARHFDPGRGDAQLRVAELDHDALARHLRAVGAREIAFEPVAGLPEGLEEARFELDGEPGSLHVAEAPDPPVVPPRLVERIVTIGDVDAFVMGLRYDLRPGAVPGVRVVAVCGEVSIDVTVGGVGNALELLKALLAELRC